MNNILNPINVALSTAVVGLIIYIWQDRKATVEKEAEALKEASEKEDASIKEAVKNLANQLASQNETLSRAIADSHGRLADSMDGIRNAVFKELARVRETSHTELALVSRELQEAKECLGKLKATCAERGRRCPCLNGACPVVFPGGGGRRMADPPTASNINGQE